MGLNYLTNKLYSSILIGRCYEALIDIIKKELFMKSFVIMVVSYTLFFALYFGARHTSNMDTLDVMALAMMASALIGTIAIIFHLVFLIRRIIRNVKGLE